MFPGLGPVVRPFYPPARRKQVLEESKGIDYEDDDDDDDEGVLSCALNACS